MSRQLFHKIVRIMLLWQCVCWTLQAQRGIPFFVNYEAEAYDAHNRNFDVVCDSKGNAYFANFEGVLYYNGDRWNILRTPEMTRITRLYVDGQDHVWVGGYNFVGKIVAGAQGSPKLLSYLSNQRTNYQVTRIGEVLQIEGTADRVQFHTATHCISVVQDTLVQFERQAYQEQTLLAHNNLKLDDGIDLQVAEGKGLAFYQDGHYLYQLTASNGLCSNTVHAIATDGAGTVWGATDNGIFALYAPSFFTRYTAKEGLVGEITCIRRYQQQLYVGTLHGLFRFHPRTNSFEPMPAIQQACWQLHEVKGHLYAVTSNGLFCLQGEQLHSLSQRNLFSMAADAAGHFYVGGLDGIYRMQGSQEQLLSSVERAMKLHLYHDQLWAETLYGEIYQLDLLEGRVTQLDSIQGLSYRRGNKLYHDPVADVLYLFSIDGILRWSDMDQRFVPDNGPLQALVQQGHWWPGVAVSNQAQQSWVTGGDGKEVIILNKGRQDPLLQAKVHLLHDYALRVLYVEEDGVTWAGGNFGLIRIDLQKRDDAFLNQASVAIRAVSLQPDSLYADTPLRDAGQVVASGKGVTHRFASQYRTVKFTFSTTACSVIESPRYAYYLEGYESDWSPWQEGHEKEYTNLLYGSYVFHVKAMDAFGRETPVSSFAFVIEKPFYWEWYSLLGYFLLFVGLMTAFFKWRTYKLRQETLRLEQIVQERTRQIRTQRDEITEKSQRLQQALEELNAAQEQLIRQEKAATVGKLTQGLIDRILNPMNYIINFSHLSNGLLKDMQEDLEEVADQIDTDTYEDLEEIREMMQTHLRKIEEHGHNTSRILKAMEELLTDHRCHLVPTALNGWMRQLIEQANASYRQELEELGISITCDYLPDEVEVDMDPLLLGRVLLSLVQNSLYALQKKKEKGAVAARLELHLRQQDEEVEIRLYDNGNGIDPHIIGKIFDPFFTTKTSSEAAGVGLYLCREILLNHHGHIEVQSEKDQYAQFEIRFPIHQPSNTTDNE